MTGSARDAALEAWQDAPAARFAHPDTEHLLPLMVVVGAAGGSPGEKIYAEHVLETAIAGFRFD